MFHLEIDFVIQETIYLPSVSELSACRVLTSKKFSKYEAQVFCSEQNKKST